LIGPEFLSGSLRALLLIMAANVAPWAAGQALRGRFAAPLDFGAALSDGTRVLGDHKTWRGLIAGAAACAIAARICGLTFLIGAAFGTLSLIGDTASSFVKRRYKFSPGKEIPGLDQLPEALLPLVILSRPLGIGAVGWLPVAAVFLLLDLAVIRLRHWQA
jgi:CDP-2,3-bis-(O-geranylgeranyl)-sn-glycerol synthase